MKEVVKMSECRSIVAGQRLVALDVGAARGLLPHWRDLAGSAFMYMVEPDTEAHPGIEESLNKYARPGEWKILGVALSGTGGPRVLHVLATHTGSSLLPLRLPDALSYVDKKHVFPIRNVEIQTRSLRDVMDECDEPVVDFIKLDTQGTELDILIGFGDERLGSLLSVEVEVGMPGQYEGQPQFSQVHEFMTRHDMDLFDLMPKRQPLVREGNDHFYSDYFGTYANAPTIAGRLLEVDAVYIKNPSVVLAAKSAPMVRRLVVAYGNYGYFAHAYRLAETARDAKILSSEDMNSIHEALRAWHRRVHRTSAPLNIASRVIFKLCERFTPEHQAELRRTIG